MKTQARMEDLFEISKLFARFDDIEHTFAPTMEIATRTLSLRSAILMETQAGHEASVNVWPANGQFPELMQEVKEHVATAYAYLVGEHAQPVMQWLEHGQWSLAKRLIVIPLAVAQRMPFGALAMEGVTPLDKADLIFINAIANQLAVALDRAHAWQRDVLRRERAEGDLIESEIKGASSEQGRLDAESSSDRYQALADDNARLLEQAQQAIREREQILAIVSHDLRNPLGAILMTTSALAKRTVTEERRRGLSQAVTRIHRSAERMLRLIEDLLDFASIEAGRLAMRRGPQDAAAIVQEAFASFEGAAQDKGLQLIKDLEPRLPPIHCDRDRLLQVLSNLVGNAIKATPEGGRITLRLQGVGHEVTFMVADNGPGIGDEDVKHLFERYFRGHESQYRGTGLGLAIAQGIVVAHGGRIWVETALGQGSTFSFTIPTADTTLIFSEPLPGDAPPFLHRAEPSNLPS